MSFMWLNGLKRTLHRTSGRFSGRLFGSLDLHSLHSMRVWIVMGVLSLLIILAGYTAQSRYGLLVGFLVALLLNSLVFFYSDLRLSSLFPSHELEGRDPWGLLRTVRELTSDPQMRMKRPQVMLIESPIAILFSAGLLSNRSTIYISSEIVKRFTQEEVRAFLAFELVRLKNQSTASATAASALAGFVALIAEALDSVLTLRAFRKGSSRHQPGLRLGPFTILSSPVVALILRGSVSRKEILQADRQTAQWLGNPEVLARALWKLESYTKTKPFSFNLAEAHLFAVSPLLRYRAWQFASNQPRIQARLKGLLGRETI